MVHEVKDAQASREDPVATENQRAQRCRSYKRNQAPLRRIMAAGLAPGDLSCAFT